MNTNIFILKGVFLLLITLNIYGQTRIDSTIESGTVKKPTLKANDHKYIGSDATADGSDPHKTQKAKPMFGPGKKQSNDKEKQSGLGMSMIQYVSSIGIVILMMVGVLWLLNRVNSGSSISNRKSFIKVTNRVHLDSKNSLALIEFQNDQLLIGIGANGITLLNKNCQNNDAGTVVGGTNHVDS